MHKHIQKIWVGVFALAAVLVAAGTASATSVGTNISTAALTATGALTVSGATTLSSTLTLTSTSNPQVTVKYDATDYLTAGVSSTGVVTFDSVGTALRNALTFSD